jgi:hypothetical protein
MMTCTFLAKNPLGHRSANFGPPCNRVLKDVFARIKRLRKMKHTRPAVNIGELR